MFETKNIKCSDTILKMAEEISLETGGNIEVIIIDLLNISSFFARKRNKGCNRT